jgi:hypothetical protein
MTIFIPGDSTLAGWRLATSGLRLAAAGLRLAAGGWRLAAGGWRLAAGSDVANCQFPVVGLPRATD